MLFISCGAVAEFHTTTYAVIRRLQSKCVRRTEIRKLGGFSADNGCCILEALRSILFRRNYLEYSGETSRQIKNYYKHGEAFRQNLDFDC